MRHCNHCDIEFTNPTCPRCGRPPASLGKPSRPPHTSVVEQGEVSDPDATLDTMVEAASRPTLASLVKAGIKRGLIQPMAEYATRKTRT